jgi:hypothetical protein
MPHQAAFRFSGGKERGAHSAVVGFDPDDAVFVHEKHCPGTVFSLNIGQDDERVFALCKEIGHSCLDADVDPPFPSNPISGFDPDLSVFSLVNVFALLQGSKPPSKGYPPITKLRAQLRPQSL